jgi:hypothetical protein
VRFFDELHPVPTRIPTREVATPEIRRGLKFVVFMAEGIDKYEVFLDLAFP